MKYHATSVAWNGTTLPSFLEYRGRLTSVMRGAWVQGRDARALDHLGDAGGDLRRLVLLPRVVGRVLGDAPVALSDARELAHDDCDAFERGFIVVGGVGAVLS